MNMCDLLSTTLLYYFLYLLMVSIKLKPQQKHLSRRTEVEIKISILEVEKSFVIHNRLGALAVFVNSWFVRFSTLPTAIPTNRGEWRWLWRWQRFVEGGWREFRFVVFSQAQAGFFQWRFHSPLWFFSLSIIPLLTHWEIDCVALYRPAFAILTICFSCDR